MSQRRLPVYLLLDCSESMIGESIEAVQKGVDLLLKQLRSDPHALETAYVSVITFHATAQQIVPLSELSEVQTPRLEVRPGTSLGAAFQVLRDCINREVRKTTADRKGDYRPIVFLLTDGQPTDNAEAVTTAISRLTNPRIANMYAIGCGDDVDFDALHGVCDVVFRLDDMSPEKLKKLFIWLSASVQSASVASGAGDAAAGIDLSKKPADVEEVTPGSHNYDGIPQQVFLKVFCSQMRRPYLVRYRMHDGYERYVPVAVHPLESNIDSGPKFEVPAIDSSMLLGLAPCPYCENPSGGVCDCGGIMCAPDKMPANVRCPICLKSITLGQADGGSFTIKPSAG